MGPFQGLQPSPLLLVDLEKPGRHPSVPTVSLLLEAYASQNVVYIEGELLRVELPLVFLARRLVEYRGKVLVARDEPDGRFNGPDLPVRVPFEPREPSTHIALLSEELVQVPSPGAIHEEVIEPCDEGPSPAGEFFELKNWNCASM